MAGVTSSTALVPRQRTAGGNQEGAEPFGGVVLDDGWDGMIKLNRQELLEINWVMENIEDYNGRGMRNEHGPVEVVSAAQVQELTKQQDVRSWAGLVGDRAQVRCWTVQEDGQMEESWKHQGGATEEEVQQGVRELLCIREELQRRAGTRQAGWQRLVWTTGSHCCFSYLQKGSTSGTIQQLVLQVKKLELDSRTLVRLVWQPTRPWEIATADLRSLQTASTEEWTVDKEQRQQIWQEFKVQPTIDGFASRVNAVCSRFFSKWPQVGAEGVDFFTQQLSPKEVYHCCPPVHLAGHTLRRLSRARSVKAVLVLPAWSAIIYWRLLRTGTGFIPEIQTWKEWEARCTDTGLGQSLFSTGQGIRMWAALYKSGRVPQWGISKYCTSGGGGRY